MKKQLLCKKSLKSNSKKSPRLSKFNITMYYFMVILLIFVIIFIINTQHLYDLKVKINMTGHIASTVNMIREETNEPNIKYILLWTSDTATPFVYFGKGQFIFKNKSCKWTNCFVTSDRNYLGSYTEFDVIAFNGPQLSNIESIRDFPSRRRKNQKYVYANIEAATNYPVNNMWNRYFNWTWTYKLDSDAIWGYMAVRNATKHVVAPSLNVSWMKLEDMDPIDNKLKQKLQSKTKAAAWFASNCFTMSRREEHVIKIEEELRKYNLTVDIYGTCGRHHCPRGIMDRCLKELEKRYYFYFAFENALSEDYVTEKIVYALNHNTVPVVFGGANYSRFMPDGIYLNALELGPERLAKKMKEIINNSTEYHNFFKWKKYYSFDFRDESPDTDDYCKFCALINDENVMQATTIHENISSWWSDGTSYGNSTQPKVAIFMSAVIGAHNIKDFN